MKKIYGIITIIFIMLFGFLIINIQPYGQTSNLQLNNNSHIFIITNSDLKAHSHLINSIIPAMIPTMTAENYIQFQLALYPNSDLSAFMSLRDNGVSNTSDFIFSINGYYIQNGYNLFNQTFVMPYSPILPDILLIAFADTNIISANLNISMENYYASNNITGSTFAQTIYPFNNLVVINPFTYTYNSATYKTGSDFNAPNYVFYANMFNYNVANKYYTITFTDYTSFNLLIEGNNYTSTNNQVIVSLPNGSYSYSFYINGNYSTLLSDSFSVYGTPRTINLAYGHSTLLNLQALVYIALSMILLVSIIRMSGNLFSVYGISSLFFMYIGYELHIQYFGTTLIMTVITLIAGLFVYKVILE